jgi:hypothetical protein
MGVLEDAIREHLDLKRKHGASEEEVERKEVEALGPARREFEGGAEETPADELSEPGTEADEPEQESQTLLEPEPKPQPEAEPASDPEAPEQPTLEPPPPEPDLAEPSTTRLGESPAFEADFAADEEEAEDEDERMRRDWDFD